MDPENAPNTPSAPPPAGQDPDYTAPNVTVSQNLSGSFVRRHRKSILIIVIVIILGALGGAWAIQHRPQKPAASDSKTSAGAGSAGKQDASAADTWKGSVDPAAIPLGDGKVSTTPKTGYVDSCTTTFRGGGAQHAGGWIDSKDATWNSKTKVAVRGSVHWPGASYSDKVQGDKRILTTNDLPEVYPTGTFPIAATDPAYQYDRNPNPISKQKLTYTLPLDPAAAASPGCTSLGAIGVLSDGVLLFNALDAGGRDAVAHETQDSCDGHPDGQEQYHYHDVPSCLRDAAKGSSTLVGYALDGYGIYVERDSKGNLPANSDLDACHGRVSKVEWNGKKTSIYHYDATLEYPYTVGCFHGTAIAVPRQSGGQPPARPMSPRPL